MWSSVVPFPGSSTVPSSGDAGWDDPHFPDKDKRVRMVDHLSDPYSSRAADREEFGSH